MALTTAQRMDFAGDIGIADDETVFSDAELDRFYARENDNYDRAVVLALTRLLIDPVKFNRYADCSSEKDREALRKILTDLLKFWQEKAGVTGGKLRAGVIALGIDQPDPTTDTSLDTYQRDF